MNDVPIIPNPTGPTGLPHTREAAALPMFMVEDVLQEDTPLNRSRSNKHSDSITTDDTVDE
jgi:hypothetical protein